MIHREADMGKRALNTAKGMRYGSTRTGRFPPAKRANHGHYMHLAMQWLIMAGLWALTMCGVMFGLYKLFLWAMLLPTVYESQSTGYCADVIDPAGIYSCENMPPKFHHQWTP